MTPAFSSPFSSSAADENRRQVLEMSARVPEHLVRLPDPPTAQNKDPVMDNNEENAAFGTSFNSSNEESRVQPTRTNLVEVTPQEFMSLESQPSTSKGLTEIPPNGCSTPLHTAPQPVPKITIAPMGKCSSANISLNDLQNSHSN